VHLEYWMGLIKSLAVHAFELLFLQIRYSEQSAVRAYMHSERITHIIRPFFQELRSA
jgi:hypothetical protein